MNTFKDFIINEAKANPKVEELANNILKSIRNTSIAGWSTKVTTDGESFTISFDTRQQGDYIEKIADAIKDAIDANNVKVDVKRPNGTGSLYTLVATGSDKIEPRFDVSDMNSGAAYKIFMKAILPKKGKK